MRYDRQCNKCWTVIETQERMLDEAPIPCVKCDGSMVRAAWLSRPSFICEKATASESPAVTLPDGREVKIKTDSEARSIESNFEGIAITRGSHEMNQEAAIKRKDSNKQLEKDMTNLYRDTYRQVINEGTQ